MVKNNKLPVKIIIIGGGPSGYTAAIEAAGRGFKVTLIEKDKLGGTCLNYGCIPIKSILSSCKLIKEIREANKLGIEANFSYKYIDLIKRKDKIISMLRSNLETLIKYKKIMIKHGDAKIIDKNTVSVNEEVIKTDFIIIATGSKQKRLGGLNPEEVFLDASLIQSDEINILGAGIIGCELATIFSLLGFKVNLFERESRILPFIDQEAVRIIENNLIKNGVKINVNYTPKKNKEFIVCCGREANLPESNVSLRVENSFIKVDNNLRTNIDTIYAIGDVNGNKLLAYWAMSEGKKVIDIIENKPNKIEFESCPSVISTSPEISFFGEIKPEYKTLKSNFNLNGKALSESATEGFIKLFINNKNILKSGIIVGKNGSEMITQLSFFHNKNINELKTKMFYHPSFSETIINILGGL